MPFWTKLLDLSWKPWDSEGITEDGLKPRTLLTMWEWMRFGTTAPSRRYTVMICSSVLKWINTNHCHALNSQKKTFQWTPDFLNNIFPKNFIISIPRKVWKSLDFVLLWNESKYREDRISSISLAALKVTYVAFFCTILKQLHWYNSRYARTLTRLNPQLSQ